MAESASFEPVRRGSDHVAAAPRADETSAGVQASRPRSAGGLLGPSQVPLPGETARQPGFPPLADAQPHHGRQWLRPSGAPAGAALPLARPSTVAARPIQDVLRGPGQPLADPIREEMEARLGRDFSQVRLHTDGAARASAVDVGARAYTCGNHIVIGDGGADKHTLAHELTHVTQQNQGPVAGTDHGNGLKVSNPSDRFEREAAANAARVMSGPTPGRSTGHASTRPDSASAAGRGSAIQRAIPPGDLQIHPAYPHGWKVFEQNLHHDSATFMEAELHPGWLKGGSEVGGSKPTWAPKPWPVAGTAGISPDTVDFFRNHVVQAHLLNQNLGGKGERQNLAPLSKAGNTKHFQAAEDQIKKEVNQGNVVRYEVVVHYDISGDDLVGSSAAAKPAVVTDIDTYYHDKIALDMSADYAVYEQDPNPPNAWKRQYGSDWHVDGRGK